MDLFESFRPHLAFGLLASVVALRGAPVVKRTLFGPIEEREAQRQALALKVGQKEEQQLGKQLAAGVKTYFQRAGVPLNGTTTSGAAQ